MKNIVGRFDPLLMLGIVILTISFIHGWYYDTSKPRSGLGWADQTLYHNVTTKLATSTPLTSRDFHYQMGYSLLGTVTYFFIPNDPFMPVSFILLVSSFIFCYLGARIHFNRLFIIIFLLFLFFRIGDIRHLYYAQEIFLIAWNNQVLFLCFAYFFWAFSLKSRDGKVSLPILLLGSILSGYTITTREESFLFVFPLLVLLIYKIVNWRTTILLLFIFVIALSPNLIIKYSTFGSFTANVRPSDEGISYIDKLATYASLNRLAENIVYVVIDSSLSNQSNINRDSLLQANPWFWLAIPGLLIYIGTFKKKAPTFWLSAFIIFSLALFVFYLAGENMSAQKLKFHCLRYISPSYIMLAYISTYALSTTYSALRTRNSLPLAFNNRKSHANTEAFQRNQFQLAKILNKIDVLLIIGIVLIAIHFYDGWYDNSSKPHAGIGWADQTYYHRVTEKLVSSTRLTANDFHYQMGYSLLGAAAHPFSSSDPFMPVSAILLISSFVFCYLGAKTHYNPVFLAIFLLFLFFRTGKISELYYAQEIFLIPWNNQVLFMCFAYFFWAFSIKARDGKINLLILILGSIISGYTVTTREESILFVLPLLVLLMYKSVTWRVAIILMFIFVMALSPNLIIKYSVFGNFTENVRPTDEGVSYIDKLASYVNPQRFIENMVYVVFNSSLSSEPDIKRLALLQANPWFWLAIPGLLIYIASLKKANSPFWFSFFMFFSVALFIFYLSGENMSVKKLRFHCLRYITPSYIILAYLSTYSLHKLYSYIKLHNWIQFNPAKLRKSQV